MSTVLTARSTPRNPLADTAGQSVDLSTNLSSQLMEASYSTSTNSDPCPGLPSSSSTGHRTPSSPSSHPPPGAESGLVRKPRSTFRCGTHSHRHRAANWTASMQGARQQMVARFANGIAWPRLTPDDAGIIYDTYDAGGQPHIWRFDLATHTATQLSEATGSIPVFVNPNVIWFDEEQRCRCGTGVAGAPDGE